MEMEMGASAAAAAAPSLPEPNALLRDLYEKKRNIRRIATEVGSMASELRDVRSRLASQDAHLHDEKGRRQTAEAKAAAMEKELVTLQKSLDERNAMAISTASVAEQYLRELVDVRARLGSAQELAEARAEAAETAESQCAILMKEIEKQNDCVQEHELHAADLCRQISELQDELRCKESAEQHLREEMEMKMKLAITAAMASTTQQQKDGEIMNSNAAAALQGLLLKSSEQLSKGYVMKDEEIARLREEITLLSAQLKLKTQELESQRERHLTVEQDLKKRVLKLEFWLQEARAQTRKLQKIVEKREKEIKELKVEIGRSNSTSPNGIMTQKKGGNGAIWLNPKFRLLASLSAAVLLFCAKR